MHGTAAADGFQQPSAGPTATRSAPTNVQRSGRHLAPLQVTASEDGDDLGGDLFDLPPSIGTAADWLARYFPTGAADPPGGHPPHPAERPTPARDSPRGVPAAAEASTSDAVAAPSAARRLRRTTADLLSAVAQPQSVIAARARAARRPSEAGLAAAGESAGCTPRARVKTLALTGRRSDEVPRPRPALEPVLGAVLHRQHVALPARYSADDWVVRPSGDDTDGRFTSLTGSLAWEESPPSDGLNVVREGKSRAGSNRADGARYDGTVSVASDPPQKSAGGAASSPGTARKLSNGRWHAAVVRDVLLCLLELLLLAHQALMAPPAAGVLSAQRAALGPALHLACLWIKPGWAMRRHDLIWAARMTVLPTLARAADLVIVGPAAVAGGLSQVLTLLAVLWHVSGLPAARFLSVFPLVATVWFLIDMLVRGENLSAAALAFQALCYATRPLAAYAAVRGADALAQRAVQQATARLRPQCKRQVLASALATAACGAAVQCINLQLPHGWFARLLMRLTDLLPPSAEDAPTGACCVIWRFSSPGGCCTTMPRWLCHDSCNGSVQTSKRPSHYS